MATALTIWAWSHVPAEQRTTGLAVFAAVTIMVAILEDIKFVFFL